MLGGQQVGIVTNPTGVTPDLTHIVDVMAAADRSTWSPSSAPSTVSAAPRRPAVPRAATTTATGLPVYDTYLKSGAGARRHLPRSGVDTVVFDIQDVGARFYTYIWTLYDCMEAAALAGKRFVVLDRPNPLDRTAAARPGAATGRSRRSSGASRSRSSTG